MTLICFSTLNKPKYQFVNNGDHFQAVVLNNNTYAAKQQQLCKNLALSQFLCILRALKTLID